MDVNNLKARLDSIHYATNSRFDIDYKKYAKITPLETGGVTVTLPGNIDPVKVKVDIYSIIHHLAAVKDHLKNQLEIRGLDKKIVEREIDSSLHLQVLIDLDNAYKHGYPLTKHIRSNKNPVIEKMTYTLVNNNNGKEVIMSIGPKGELDILEGVPPSVALFGNIFDDAGNYLFSFDDLVEMCYTKWLSIITKYNLI